ncbi:MAG: tetratricopeptide repeat protein [candidate division Zixibacteria bacterium]
MSKNKLVMLIFLLVLAVVLTGCANKFTTSGKIAMGSKRWDKAIGDFKLALEQTPNDGEVHYLIARCYKEKDDYAAMVSHLNAADTLYVKGAKKIHDLREGTWKELFESGNTNTKNGNYEKARGEFETAIGLMPDNYAAHINLGVACQNLEDSACAYSSFKEAYRLEPEKIPVLENFANYCFNVGKYDEADGIYTIILEKESGNVIAIINKGTIASLKGDYETAVNYYNTALENESDNCDLWFNLGVLYFQQIKNNDEALNAFSRAVELCPEDISAHINLNVALLSLKKFDEAVTNLETFTQDFPDECVGWDLYSQALLQKGMRSQALDAQKKFEECKGE